MNRSVLIGYVIFSVIAIWGKRQPESLLWSALGPMEHLSLTVQHWQRMGEYLDGQFHCSLEDVLIMSGHASIWIIGAVLSRRVVAMEGSRSSIFVLVAFWIVICVLNFGLAAIRAV